LKADVAEVKVDRAEVKADDEEVKADGAEVNEEMIEFRGLGPTSSVKPWEPEDK
jgi:hypothetical protein